MLLVAIWLNFGGYEWNKLNSYYKEQGLPQKLCVNIGRHGEKASFVSGRDSG
jgi:hypothetical protein